MNEVIEKPAATEVQANQPPKVSLLAKIASRYNVEPTKMLATLKATAFKGDVSNEQMMALLIVADQYGLNPWTKEVYAFPDKNNGIVPVVGVDGWSRIINSNPLFDGMVFNDGPVTDKTGLPEWIECVIHRKDRTHPVTVREYMSECKRGTGPWQSHPRRMLRHKAMIQCARVAFGYVGIYDQDEAERIVEGEVRIVPNDAIDELNRKLEPRDPLPVGHTIDMEPARAKAAPEPELETPAAEHHRPEDADTGAPSITFAELEARLRGARTLDELDEHASLIATMPPDMQQELSDEYGRRRKQIKGK
jgi:phage recombination protein Bet